MKLSKTNLTIMAFSLIILPTKAFADIGLPMIAIYLPPAWLALIPVIIIEAFVGIWMYGITAKRAFLGQSIKSIKGQLSIFRAAGQGRIIQRVGIPPRKAGQPPGSKSLEAVW